MTHDVQKIVSAMTADFHGPVGPIPVERLLRKYHHLLADLRKRGLTWEQISRLLAGGGIKHRNGLAFPAAHLRGVFRRHLSRGSEPYSHDAAARSGRVNTASRSREAIARSAATKTSISPASGVIKHGTPPGDRPASGQGLSSPDNQPRGSALDDRAQVFAVMRQSIQARRLSK